MYSFVKRQIMEGRQAYVVYPRVEETGPNASRNALQSVTLLDAIAELKLEPAAKKGVCSYFPRSAVAKIKAALK